MSKRSRIAGLTAAAVLAAGLAWAQQAAKPVNLKCPMKPDVRVDPAQTVTYKGKVYGFCCSDCTEKFKKNPEAWAGRIKEDAAGAEPEGMASAKDAVTSGKAGGYLTVVLFADKTARTQAFVKLISDAAVVEELAKCAYAKVEYKKDSEDAKLLKVTSAPTLLLIDPRGDEPKVLKTLAGGDPKKLVKELQDAAKKMAEGK